MKDIKLLIRDLNIILKELFQENNDYSYFNISLSENNYYGEYTSTYIGITVFFDYGDGHSSSEHLYIDTEKDLKTEIIEYMIKNTESNLKSITETLTYWKSRKENQLSLL